MESEPVDYMDELLDLQYANDVMHARVKRLQEEHANLPEKTDEHHIAWRDAWEDWRVEAELLEDVLTYFSEKLGLDRDELAAAVREEAARDEDWPPVED